MSPTANRLRMTVPQTDSGERGADAPRECRGVYGLRRGRERHRWSGPPLALERLAGHLLPLLLLVGRQHIQHLRLRLAPGVMYPCPPEGRRAALAGTGLEHRERRTVEQRPDLDPLLALQLESLCDLRIEECERTALLQVDLPESRHLGRRQCFRIRLLMRQR